GGGRRGVKEKQEGKQRSANDTIKVSVVKPSTKDGPVLSSSGGHTVEKVTESRNNEGTQDDNVGQTLIRSTVDPNLGNGTGVALRLEYIRAISERFVNMTYAFFLGKRVACRVVANYVRNTWGKYGLVKSMLNSSTGLFFFQFSSMIR
ncbi:hypothetical protein Tco_1436193, partial [Tanacetum coccineum]